jgi:hypothetical protein
LLCVDVASTLTLGQHEKRGLESIEDRIGGDVLRLGVDGSLEDMDAQALVPQRARPQTISANQRDESIERYQTWVHK